MGCLHPGVLGDPIVPSEVLGSRFEGDVHESSASKQDKHSYSAAMKEATDKVHAVYIQKLQELFDANKDKYGDAGKQLLLL